MRNKYTYYYYYYYYYYTRTIQAVPFLLRRLGPLDKHGRDLPCLSARDTRYIYRQESCDKAPLPQRYPAVKKNRSAFASTLINAHAAHL